MAASSPKKFLTMYFGLTASLLLGIVAINAVVDPLWVYHAPWLPQRFVKDQRQANPGVARHSKYNAVVIGNSLTENLLVSEIQSNFGWDPIKLCISGSTGREQRLILEQALKTGQVRHVLWAVDFFAFDFEPDVVRTADFPFHIYDPGFVTPFRYLISASTLMNSLQVLFGGGVKDQESRFVWHHKMTYGTESVMHGWRKITSKRDALGKTEEVALRSAQEHLIKVIQANPEIHFHIFIPPYSALYGVSEMLDNGDRFAARMRFKRQVAQALLACSNVELFDFESAVHVTRNLENYTDLVHYNLATSSSILRWIAEGKFQLHSHSLDDRIREVEERTFDYAQQMFARDNPLREQLHIDATSLKLPTAIVSAVPETTRPILRIAEGDAPQRY